MYIILSQAALALTVCSADETRVSILHYVYFEAGLNTGPSHVHITVYTYMYTCIYTCSPALASKGIYHSIVVQTRVCSRLMYMLVYHASYATHAHAALVHITINVSAIEKLNAWVHTILI